MPWSHKECKCIKPTSQEIKDADVGPGSIWDCPNCNKRWLFTGSVMIMGGDGFTPYVPEVHDDPDLLTEEQVQQEVGLNQ